MPDSKQIAFLMLQKNPQVARSPMGQRFMQALQSNNDADGIAMAEEILSTYNISKEQAIQQATAGLFGRR